MAEVKRKLLAAGANGFVGDSSSLPLDVTVRCGWLVAALSHCV
jgi:hypothetical protein